LREENNVKRSTKILLACGLLLACSQPSSEPPSAKGFRDYLAAANEVVVTVPAAEAVGLMGDSQVAFVDIREQSELDESGWIPDAVHAPRGLLEFYIDSSSSSHKEVFSSGKRIVFYCAGGARSALAAQLAMDMGLADVAHVGGGFRAWVEAGGPVDKAAADGG
jgi:rhodanese-related sulfurtransferase